MLNEAQEDVKAYWFFTPYTIPDRQLLHLLTPDKHEIALHVAVAPYLEWKKLEEKTNRRVMYYTIHGTARLIARLMWRRKIWETKASVPVGFPLKSFYDFPTLALDWLCYRNPTAQAVKFARGRIAKGEIMHVHPEWLFDRGTLNHRGPYYETLKSLLHADMELDSLVMHKKAFVRVAKYSEEEEYLRDAVPSSRFLEKLAERNIDIFTFIERKWCCTYTDPGKDWLRAEDNIALLESRPYNEWLNIVGKKTRNMIRKAEKADVETEVTAPSDKLSEGIWKIYNETPIRQGRAFSHFGIDLQTVKATVAYHAKDSIFIGAYLERELVGFVQLIYGDQIAVMAQILSLQRHWDKAVNNALIAKAVEVCEKSGVSWLMYGRMGNHPSLDAFKKSNGFSKFNLTRYYVPLTRKGRIAARLGLHKEAKNALPEPLKGALIPLFNWVSRTKEKWKRNLSQRSPRWCSGQ